MSVYRLTIPLDLPTRRSLHAGDIVYLSGVLYTARDAAHKRIVEALRAGSTPPIPLRDAAIYYCGPTPALPGEIIGSCGPTTSSRMDAYAPDLIAAGSVVMVGKGKRSPAVIRAMQTHSAVYLAAVGGAAALVKSCVTSCECVAYPDLGCEAIYRLQVKDFETVVAVDSTGNTILK